MKLLKDLYDLKDFYGSEEKENKDAVVLAIIFFFISLALLMVAKNPGMDNITRFLLIYLILFLWSVSLFSASSYFFFKKKNKEKYKSMKYVVFIISLIFFTLCFIPITFIAFLTGKIKFDYFLPNAEKYLIVIFLPMIFMLFVGVMIYFFSSRIEWLNAYTVSALSSFLLWMWSSRFLLWLGKNRLKAEVYASIKKDLYVIIFAIITLVTIIAACIKFSGVYDNITKGFTSAFGIYIAFDRLFSKWDKANKDLESSRSK